LIIDDCFNVRKLLRAALERLGFETIEASGGVDAIEILKKRLESVDLLIVDLLMPDIHGYDLIKAIRALPCKRKPRIFVFTGVADSKEVLRLAALKIDAYMVKPLELATLSKRLDAVFPPPPPPVETAKSA